MQENLLQPNASETIAGRVEVATNAEVAAHTKYGSTGARLVVPADVATTFEEYWGRNPFTNTLSPVTPYDNVEKIGSMTVNNLYATTMLWAETTFQTAPACKIGFYAATPISKPVVTGSCGGINALQDLVARLSDLGLIQNSTTP